LCARQNDKVLETFPIWDDVQTFDGKPWRGIVDVVSGGFPCQDISVAGKGDGLDGERSGMWREMARIIGEVRPRFAFVENSPMLVTRGLERVLADLTAMGYDSRWGIISAADIGAKHKRERIWIVAHSNSNGWPISEESRSLGTSISKKQKRQIDSCHIEGTSSISSPKRNVPDTNNQGLQGGKWIRNDKKKVVRRSESAYGATSKCNPTFGTEANWWNIEPNVGRVADGVAARVDRLKAIGNGQVPLCAATAWRILSESL
jgi:DNA (cytosine-5)-methyltransferase 1